VLKKIGRIKNYRIIGTTAAPARPPRQDLSLLAEVFLGMFAVRLPNPHTTSMKPVSIDGGFLEFFQRKWLY
jgi:hypothetical protein